MAYRAWQASSRQAAHERGAEVRQRQCGGDVLSARGAHTQGTPHRRHDLHDRDDRCNMRRAPAERPCQRTSDTHRSPTSARAPDDDQLDLVRHVLGDCAAQGTSVAPQLALEAARLLQAGPGHREATADGGLVPDHPLRAACALFLLNKQAPGLAATRMRVAFRRKYRTPEATAAEQAHGTESRVAPILAEVLSDVNGDVAPASPPPAPPAAIGIATRGASRGGRGAGRWREHRERLYGNVVAAAILRSGLGSPADPAVIREASAAMQSVYPAKDMEHLLQLPPEARGAQLLEVCRISAGIRIFNWNCRKTGHGHSLLDLPTLVQEAAAVTRAALIATVEGVECRLWPATRALEAAYLHRGAAGPAVDCAEVDLDLLKETVVYLRQQQVLFRRLLEDVEGAGAGARRLVDQLQVALAGVHAVVQAKTAVPTNQVYPHFLSLASTWESLHTHAVVVSKAANLHRRLEAYTQGVVTVGDDVVSALVAGGPTGVAPTDAERVSAALPLAPGSGLSEKQLEAARRRLARDMGRGDVAAELKGFCPWFLAVSGGGLVPGCPAIGLCEAGGRLHALSSPLAAGLFTADPKRWTQRALDEARRRPALVGLLELSDALWTPAANPPGDSHWPGSPTSAKAGEACGVRTVDAEVQTEAAPGPGVARRRGPLAVLPVVVGPRGRRAACTQTEASSYRRECHVQTFPPRHASVQCARSAACSAGLLGASVVVAHRGAAGAPAILATGPTPASDDDHILVTSFPELSSASGASPSANDSESARALMLSATD